MTPEDAEKEVMEREANYFAMCLLMPEEWLRRDVEAIGGVDIEDDVAMTKLAKKYKVSVTLMAMRLGQLGAIKKL